MTAVKTQIGAHDEAYQTSFSPTATISATDVQRAIEAVAAGGGGGGAPSDAGYYVTASNATLSNETVIPAFIQTLLDDTSQGAAQTTLGLVPGTDVQAFGAVLDDLNTLGAASTDGEFIVATGAGAFAYESGATARTSLGLGTIATEAETNYALLAGRSGGQTLIGGTGSGDDLKLTSTSNATKGTLQFGDDAVGMFLDEANNRWSLGDPVNSMVIGGGAVPSTFAVHANAGEAALEVHGFGTGSSILDGPVLYGGRADGSLGSESVVVDTDYLFAIAAIGYDGTDYAQGGRIDFRVDGTPGAGDMPTEIIFLTSADGSESPTARLHIRAGGSVEIVTGIVPSANDGAALGSTSLQFSDVFLASGGVANWANGDVTITHSSNLLTLGGGNFNFADNVLQRPEITDYGVTVNALGDLGGGTDDIDLTAGNSVSATVSTATQTFTFSNPPASGTEGKFTLYLTNGGSQTVNWPASVDWAGGSAPTLTAAGLDILVFTTIDGGTTWFGNLVGADYS